MLNCLSVKSADADVFDPRRTHDRPWGFWSMAWLSSRRPGASAEAATRWQWRSQFPIYWRRYCQSSIRDIRPGPGRPVHQWQESTTQNAPSSQAFRESEPPHRRPAAISRQWRRGPPRHADSPANRIHRRQRKIRRSCHNV